MGRARFLALYLLSALAGSALVCWFCHEFTAPPLGASGAIFGLMGALLVVARKVRANVAVARADSASTSCITFVAAATSPGRATSAASSAERWSAAILVYAPRGQAHAVPGVGLGVLLAVLLALALVQDVALA